MCSCAKRGPEQPSCMVAARTQGADTRDVMVQCIAQESGCPSAKMAIISPGCVEGVGFALGNIGTQAARGPSEPQAPLL